LDNKLIIGTYKKKLGGFDDKNQLELFLANEPKVAYDRKLITFGF